MTDLLLYLASTIAGFFLGSTIKKRQIKLPWVGKVQTVIIMIIVVVMGIRMGANREITAHLGEIGISAVVLTVLALLFTIAGLYVTRKLMKIDRYGRLKKETGEDETKEPVKGGINRMTLLILGAIVLGVLMGRFAPVFAAWDAGFAVVIKVGLCILLFSIGLDLGLAESGTQNIKDVGVRVFAFPLVTAAATLLAGLLGGLILRMNVIQSMAIVSGFAWYTLAPGIIMDAGLIQASAIALLSNILREILAFVFVPTVAKRIGYIETIGMPGAAAMDVCLPVVERSTNAEVAVYSFVSGGVLSLIVPFLVPLILSLL